MEKLTVDQRYYRKHKKKRLEDNKKYYLLNKDKYNHKNNYEAFKALCRNYYHRNKDKMKEKQKIWRKNNRNVMRFYFHKNRIKGGELTLKTIQLVYEDNIKHFGVLTCYLCLKPIEFGKDSLDHKTPLSRGGTNNQENLAIAHRSCNCKKNTKTEEEYRLLNK